MDRRRLLLLVAALIAALGVALVFVWARGAESRAADKYDTVEVLTASQKILPGEAIDDALEAGKVQLANVPKSQLLEGASESSEPLRGQVALTTLYPGEQLIPLKFGGVDEVEAAATLPIPEGKLAISVEVEDAARVGDFIRPGAEITIFLTQEGSNSRVLLERVTVLAVGRTTSVPTDGTEEEAAGGETSLLTLAVRQKEAEKVRLAETLGALSVALLNDASDVKGDEGTNPDNVFE